jgi:hypothetical protein
MFPCPLVLVTWEVMGAKHDKVKKYGAKGRLREKKLQQYSCTAVDKYNVTG